MVADSQIPKPKKVNGRVVWDRIKLDAAFTDLPGMTRRTLSTFSARENIGINSNQPFDRDRRW
jgi:hypothetical protein